MGLQIEKSFVLRAPVGQVWEFLTDPQRVARCLPGAAVTGKLDEQSWGGTITVKVGPVTANYRGKMRFERLDPAAGEAEIVASGQETRGKGGADMRMKSRVVARSPEETEVTVISDVNVVGVLAQFGRGMIQDVSDQLFQKFTEAMRRELEAAPGATGQPAENAAAPSPDTPARPSVQSPVSATSGPAAAQAAPSQAAAQAAAPNQFATQAAAPNPAAAQPAAPNQFAAQAAAPNRPAASPMPPGPVAAPPAGEPALDLGAIGGAAAARAAGRTLRRPGFWIAVVAIVVVIWFFLR